MTTNDSSSSPNATPRNESGEKVQQTASALPLLLILLAFIGAVIVYGVFSN